MLQQPPCIFVQKPITAVRERVQIFAVRRQSRERERIFKEENRLVSVCRENRSLFASLKRDRIYKTKMICVSVRQVYVRFYALLLTSLGGKKGRKWYDKIHHANFSLKWYESALTFVQSVRDIFIVSLPEYDTIRHVHTNDSNHSCIENIYNLSHYCQKIHVCNVYDTIHRVNV